MAEPIDTDRDLSRLDDWIEYCRSLALRPRDELLAGGGWVISGSTPPPIWEDPLARLPLERVEALIEAAVADRSEEAREARLREALEWLEHPHPASSPSLLERLAHQRTRLRELLNGVAP